MLKTYTIYTHLLYIMQEKKKTNPPSSSSSSSIALISLDDYFLKNQQDR